jgi:hypothetical protein
MNSHDDRRKHFTLSRVRRKMIVAALLSVVFGLVIFSVPPEKLAWEGPLVMGALAMPKPNPNPAKVYRGESREDADSLISFLGFLSVIGILGLAWGNLRPPGARKRKTDIVPSGSRISDKAAEPPLPPFF